MYKKNEQAYHELNKFVGIWNTDALIPSTDHNPEIKIQGTDRYEWILDGVFLLHTADVKQSLYNAALQQQRKRWIDDCNMR